MNIWLIRIALPDGAMLNDLRWLVLRSDPFPFSVEARDRYLQRVRDEVRRSPHFDESHLPEGWEFTIDLVEFSDAGVARLEH